MAHIIAEQARDEINKKTNQSTKQNSTQSANTNKVNVIIEEGAFDKVHEMQKEIARLLNTSDLIDTIQTVAGLDSIGTVKYDSPPLQVNAAEHEKSEPNSESVKVVSDRTEALNKLAVLWVKYNQTQRISKEDDMEWFISEYVNAVGLEYLTVSAFKKHLPKAYSAGIIDKDTKTRRYIPKIGT